MMNELMGFGAGVVIGKASSIIGSVWENGIGYGANRAALRETVTNWLDGISSTFRRAGFWLGKPDLPMPVRIYESRMPGKMATSDFWIPIERSETKMAAMIHDFQDECVLAWGWRPNEGGPDVISVNMQSGEVTFWDAKSSGGSDATMRGVGPKKGKMADWRDFALEALRANVGQASQRHVQ